MPAGAKPGERRGGREKGTPNRSKLTGLTVAEIIASENFDPVIEMIRIAQNPEHSPELRGKMNAEIASYVYPKRKAVEHTGPAGGPIEAVLRCVVERSADPEEK